jgi:hypothetical protein
MNDLDKRRAFAALSVLNGLELIEGFPIVVDGETYRCEGTRGGTGTRGGEAVYYRDSSNRPLECWFRDVLFDLAALTEEHKTAINLQEQKREWDFAGKLRKKLQNYTFDAFKETDDNRHALKRCKALVL